MGCGGSKSRLAKAAGAEPSGGMRDKKVDAAVARSTFPSQNVEDTPFSDHLRHAVVARSTCPSQNVKNTSCSDHCWTFRCRFAWQAQGMLHAAKSEQNVTVWQQFQKRWQAWEIWRGSGRWFPEMGCTLEHQILRFAKMILAWQVQHFVWPGITFAWQAQHFAHMEWKNRKTHWYEAASSALNFPFWKAISQNCFVFDVADVERWESLAELFRFWCCQVQTLKNSRRFAAFLMLSR